MTEGLQNTAQVKPGTAVSPSATPVTPPPVSDATPPTVGAAASQSRLEASGLRKSYGARVVVKEVHLAVNAGEVVGLLGPNGAGKTTTFYMVVGLVRADAGDIRIDGQQISAKPIHQRSRLGLSYLPQEASIFRKLTVDENIRAVLELQYDENGKALKTAEIDKRLDGLLNDLSLTHLRDSPPDSDGAGCPSRT